MRSLRLFIAFCPVLFLHCGSQSKNNQDGAANIASEKNQDNSPGAGPTAKPVEITLSVIGTNDLHGHIEALPLLAGYINRIREDRADDGGGVVLLDGGDLFQGTLESNSNEGQAVISAYNAIGYTAAAIGNHEFDFGPVGEKTVATDPGDDPRGALKARAVEANFPLLSANILEKSTQKPVPWPNVSPSTLVEIAGVKVGIVGGTTESTPQTTISKNVADLVFPSLAEKIKEEALKLRKQGAQVILVTIHAGGRCRSFSKPEDVSSCEGGEVFPLAKALPKGLVQVIVSGHSHAGMAHLVNGTAILESYSRGAAFGRADLKVFADSRPPVIAKIFPPQNLCGKGKPPCTNQVYEAKPIVPDPKVAAVIAPYQEKALGVRNRKTGLFAKGLFRKSYDKESALGNLVADLMLEARPKANVSMTNGGGLRADLSEGQVSFGQLFEVLPFDNRFATVKMKVKDLRKLVAGNLKRSRGILSFAGIEARATCNKGALDVVVYKTSPKRRRMRDKESITLVTSDFLAWGGDGAIGRLKLGDDAVTIENGPPLRDVLDKMLLDAPRSAIPGSYISKKQPRLLYPGRRPVLCK